jgi:Carboxypeptidase regulatory-like domain
MSRLTVVIFLMFFCIFSFSSEPQTGITGRVTDSEGAVIAKARVFIHWDSTSRELSGGDASTNDVSALSDSTGMYSAKIPVGFYDVFVSAPGFTPIAAKVIVKEGQKATLDAKLYLDPLVSKEIGGMEVEGVPPKK